MYKRPTLNEMMRMPKAERERHRQLADEDHIVGLRCGVIHEPYTLRELQVLPTIGIGQADDLKIDGMYRRVWLSRCTIEDGEPCNDKITVEEKMRGRWVTIIEYDACNPPKDFVEDCLPIFVRGPV